ncbi:hypothetical protein ACHAXR_013405 [Thalassiosira sp. AJA248-18]
MPIEINPQFAVGPVPECQLNCQHGGYCTFISTDEGTLLNTFTSGGLIEHCVCPPGYSGLACESIVEQCHDMKCHNGSPCSLMNGQYVCDCSEFDAVSSFAGAMCREPATTYCGQGDIHRRGFCTNGGLCKANLSVDSGDLTHKDYSTHKGCHCAPEFEGEHCEYLKGMTPNALSVHLKTSTDKVAPTSPNKDGVDVKAVLPPILAVQDSSNIPTQNTDILVNVGIFVGIAMSIFGIAILAKHQRRVRRNRSDRFMLDRVGYVDETPIRVRIMGELESLENGYDDDEDLHSISECSLEEIEFEDNSVANSSVEDNYREYLQNIRDGGFATYFDNTPDFTNVIGPPLEPQH